MTTSTDFEIAKQACRSVYSNGDWSDGVMVVDMCIAAIDAAERDAMNKDTPPKFATDGLIALKRSVARATLPPAALIAADLDTDIATSNWLRDAIKAARTRDPVDALKDAATLLYYCEARANEAGIAT